MVALHHVFCHALTGIQTPAAAFVPSISTSDATSTGSGFMNLRVTVPTFVPEAALTSGAQTTTTTWWVTIGYTPLLVFPSS